MYKEKDRKVTVESVLDTRSELKDGTFPIKIRVTYKAIQKYYPLCKSITKTEWEKVCKSNKGKVRLKVKAYFDQILDKVEELLDDNSFSFENLNKSLGAYTEGTLNSTLSNIISQLKSEGRHTTASSYQSALRAIERFKKGTFPLSSITPSWLAELEAHLSKSIKLSSVGIYMRAIRVAMNTAIANKELKSSSYPFGRGKYQIKNTTGTKKAIGIEAIKNIATANAFSYTTLKHRDYWLFLFFCNGMNVADFIELKYKNISDGEISYVRKKTSKTNFTAKEITISITDEVQAIIDKYGSNDKSPENYIFNFLDGTEDEEMKLKKRKNLTKCINKHMKKIGVTFGIDKLTTYVGRHSFATILKDEGVSKALIQEALGHSSMAVTENYLKSFDKKHRAEIAKLTSLK